MRINYFGTKIEIDLKEHTSAKILNQRRSAIRLQEKLMETLESPREKLESVDLPDWNELAEQISEMERELEERGYYENPDTNEWVKDDSNE